MAVNLQDWHPDLRDLAREYSPGMVITAFAVQQHLEQNGYPGIGYMETAERYMNQVGPMITQRKVESRMQQQLRAKGFA